VNTFARSLASLSAAVLCGVGVLLLVTAPAAHELAPSQARAVVGGNNNLDYTFTNCPPSQNCGQIACPNGQNSCPAGAVQVVQVRANFPSGTKAGTTYNRTNPQAYVCANITGGCANPCLQSVVNNNWYCAGPVGPGGVINGNGVVGVTVMEA
jgi:hypothetical protein